ncbi:MAG: nitroreductase family protein [Eubacteriales bacterium]|nr:nitroreductase family protein [Eubacteriales bacterium]
MTEIEAIRVRHSVRSYQSRKIEQEKIDRLEALIDEVNAAGNLHLQFMEDAGKTFQRLLSKVMGLGSAPSVIACVGSDDDTLDERIGYYGEKIVLAAQSMGLNTCWAGTFQKAGVPAEIRPGERLVIVIAIGYGENQGKQRKSKTPEQVSEVQGTRPDWFDFGVEMALRAPTAINQQNFLIRLNEDNSVDFFDKGGPFSKVDLGIVKYHFDVGAEYRENGGTAHE